MFPYIDLRGLEQQIKALAATGWATVLFGRSLVLLGPITLLWPQVLVVLASAFFVSAGVITLIAGIQTLALRRRYQRWKRRILG